MDSEDRYRAIAFARARAIAESEKIAHFFPGTGVRLVPTPAIYDHHDRRSWTAFWLDGRQPIGSVRATDPVEAVDALLCLLARLVSRLGRGHAE